MNENTRRLLAIICLVAIILAVFTGCKGNNEEDPAITTDDPFASTEYAPSSSAVVPDSSSSELFDDFATTTKPASTAPRTTSSSGSGSYTFPTTDGNVTLPPDIDPGVLTSSSSSGSSIDIKKALIAAGYSYDPEEECFYSNLDSWQRKGGFAPHYDIGAFVLSMHYLTYTVDFDWGGESWRLQFWKGNYGPFLDGAEIGVYTKELGADTSLYDTADDQHLLNMSMTLYSKRPADETTRLFGRPATDHWWLTGFKPTYTQSVPGEMVLIAKIRFRDSQMAKSFASSLEKVRGLYAPNRSFRCVSAEKYLTDDTYCFDGNAVILRWRAIGWLNYDYPSNNSNTTTTQKSNG